MKLTNIEMGMKHIGYASDSIPGIRCEVELKHPDSYSTLKIKLSDDQVKAAVAFIVEQAMSHLIFDPETINVQGWRGTPPPPPEETPAKDDVL